MNELIQYHTTNGVTYIRAASGMVNEAGTYCIVATCESDETRLTRSFLIIF